MLEPVATRISLVRCGGKRPCSTTPGVWDRRVAGWAGASTGPRESARGQQFERDRRSEGGDQLVRGCDDHEALGGGGDHLLARVRAAATLYEPPRRRDLVGSVDRKIEAAEACEGAHIQPELARRARRLRR